MNAQQKSKSLFYHRNYPSRYNRAAIAYKANLVGKTFVYVFDDRYIEVIYKAINF